MSWGSGRRLRSGYRQYGSAMMAFEPGGAGTMGETSDGADDHSLGSAAAADDGVMAAAVV